MPTRTLTLLRHGKSSWSDPRLADRERPLNRRGCRDVPLMAERLQRLGVRPSLIVASPAVRTWETAKLLAESIGYPREFMHRESDLYLADADTIAAVIGTQDDAFKSMLVCGHNPGLTSFANRLVPRLTDNVPTSGCVVVEANCESWLLFADADVRLIAYDYPKRRD